MFNHLITGALFLWAQLIQKKILKTGLKVNEKRGKSFLKNEN